MHGQGRIGVGFTGLLGLLIFSSGCAYFPLKKSMPINQLGRFWGVGFSDGYHECDPRFLRERCGSCCGTTCQSDCNACGMYQVNAHVVPSSYNASAGTFAHGMMPNGASVAPGQTQPLWDGSPFPSGVAPNANLHAPNPMSQDLVPRSSGKPNEPKREEIPLPSKESSKAKDPASGDSDKTDEELLPADPWSPSDRQSGGNTEGGGKVDGKPDPQPGMESPGTQTDVPKSETPKAIEPKKADPPIANSSDDDLLVPLDARARTPRSLLQRGPTRSVNRYAPYSPSTYR